MTFLGPNIPVLIDHVTPVAKADWERIYGLDPSAVPSQSRTWADLIVNSFGATDRSRHYRFSDGAEAILPLFSRHRAAPPFRVYRSPPPAWGFGGLLCSAPLTRHHVRVVLDDCALLPGAAVQVRPIPLHAALWEEAAHGTAWKPIARSAHVIDLSGGFDQVWETRFPARTRSKVRKAEKLGVTVESGTSEALVEDFDRLFRTSVARWAHGQNELSWLAALRAKVRDPKGKFASMARDASRVLRIYVAYLGGTPVAGIIVLLDRNGHYTRGAMDKALIGNSYANYLLQKVAIEDACRLGARHYHMGETGGSDSLADFKSRFGATAVPYAEYRFERIPVLSADQRLRSIVKNVIGFKDA